MLNLSALLASTALLGAAPAPDNCLLDFTATWCGPCQEMSSVVSQLERQGHPIRKVDIDREPALAQEYRVQNIPTFILVANGREVRRIVGKTSESQLRSLLALLPARSPDPPQLQPELRLASAGDPAPPSLPPAAPSKKQFPFSLLAGNNAAAELRPSAAPQLQREPVIRANHDAAAAPPNDRPVIDPLAATVRIRVRDVDGANFGSGTIIDSRPGRTVVLSCGHIFRDLPPETQLEVDVFHDGRHETYVGKVLHFDLEADVGLCTIPTDNPLPIATLSDSAAPVKVGDLVASIGCSAGRAPTKLMLNVTALNRYLGPDNVECSVAPEQGRSGGGLFDHSGNLVGVCIAADRRENRGLYAGLQAVRDVLAAAGLSSSSPDADPGRNAAEVATADAADFPQRSPSTAAAAGLQAVTGSSKDTGPMADVAAPFGTGGVESHPSAPIEGEAEVVCIIRPLNNPRAASRVIIINRASEKFISYLADELDQQPRPTMHTVKFEKPIVADQVQPAADSRSVTRTADATAVPLATRYRRTRSSRE